VCNAYSGALVGPPWAKRENGFVFSEAVKGGVSLYYEPHCDYDVQSLQGVDSVDVVITPGINQELLSFPLVSHSLLSPCDPWNCFASLNHPLLVCKCQGVTSQEGNRSLPKP